MWLKENYAIFLKRNDKAYIYDIWQKDDEFVSHWFQIVPYGVAAVIKLIGEGYSVENIITHLVSRGMPQDKADKLIENIIAKYRYLFTDEPPKRRFDDHVLEEVSRQFGKIPFNYEDKKYCCPKNVILEVFNDETGYIKYDTAQKIHKDCYIGGVENIFYNGKKIIEWEHIGSFVRKNSKNKISSVIQTDLSVDSYQLLKVIECGITRVQVYYHEYSKLIIDNLLNLLQRGVVVDLFLQDIEFRELLQLSIENFGHKLNKVYVVNTKLTEVFEKTKKYLLKSGLEPIMVTGCANTSFGERSCFKSGVMNLSISSEGKAVFCLTGGRHIVLGDANKESIKNIWNCFDASADNRKKLFSFCKNL